MSSNNWKTEIENAYTCFEDVSKVINLTQEEEVAVKLRPKFPFMITPYLANLIKDNEALRKAYIPNMLFNGVDNGVDDPLEEEEFMKTNCLIHRYKNRVLLLATNNCASYCRYCTRARRVGKNSTHDIMEAIEYIKNHKEINDVLISGGDPLIMEDEFLDDLLSKIRAIPHVLVIRIGSNIFNVMPSRITDNLVNILKKYRPLWLSLHFTHPAEITKECEEALDKISRAGIPMLSQTVLLKGINDDEKTIEELMLKLIKNNVKPYYLHHCDNIKGSDYFKVELKRGLEIIKYLKDNISGFAVPEYCYDVPGAKSKIRIDTTTKIK